LRCSIGFFDRPSRFLIGADAGAVEERHPKLNSLLLEQREQAFPHPSRDQRMKIYAAIHHGPRPSGTARHLAPLSCRHRIVLMVRRPFRQHLTHLAKSRTVQNRANSSDANRS